MQAGEIFVDSLLKLSAGDEHKNWMLLVVSSRGAWQLRRVPPGDSAPRPRTRHMRRGIVKSPVPAAERTALPREPTLRTARPEPGAWTVQEQEAFPATLRPSRPRASHGATLCF